jgi:hypothetical protein
MYESSGMAWSPLVAVPTPQLTPEQSQRARNPIDHFVIAKLAEKGLTPSPEADRRTLIRRLYFDLIGLPPTPEEVAKFVDDSDPQAYEKLVDALLASPHYGERWARHWLDVVRYADTHGYDKDQPRPHAWPYRDYVIRAFNSDKPWGRFVAEQVAGDVLYPNTADGIEALGFLAAGPWDLIGHAEVPETKIDGKIARLLDRDDMVSNVMNSFLSVTVQCARCHDHKFDPISQEDYYSLQATVAALDRAPKKYDPDPQLAARRTSLENARNALQAKLAQLRTLKPGPDADRLKGLDEQIAKLADKQPGTISKVAEFGYHSAISSRAEDPKWVQVDLGVSEPLSKITLQPCHDDFNNIGSGFGFPVRFQVAMANDPTFATGAVVVADYTLTDFPNPKLAPLNVPVNLHPARYVRVTVTKLAPRQNDFMFALAELQVLNAQGKNVAAGATVTSLDSIEAPPRWRKSNLVDGFYPGEKLSLDPEELARLRQERETLLATAMDDATRSAIAAAQTESERVAQELAALPPQKTTYVATIHHGNGAFRGTGPDGGRPREIRVLHRGDVREPRQVVGPGTAPLFAELPARFNVPSDAPEGARRRALAEWLTDQRNPLLWRSMVNRVWLYHFGRGIVDSPNDLGRMGQAPSHPELLDYLAIEFRDQGQSLKTLHRLLVNSATYRQVSTVNHACAEIDGDNVYLWRMNRRRLEAEAIHDAALLVAGKLDRTAGGAGYQDFVIEHPAHSPHYQYHLYDPHDPKSHRRSIYRFVVRSQPQPFLTTLDCADPAMSVDKRNESLTPLQALALLNNRFMLAMAENFAARLKQSPGTLEQQLETAFQIALHRSPTPGERAKLVPFAEKHGLPATCRLIFNLTEFAFVD